MNVKMFCSDLKAMPVRSHATDAGADLKISHGGVVKAGSKLMFNTGVHLEIPPGFMGLITPRSGLGTKFDIVLANTVGVIDSDYRGELKVVIRNNGEEDYKFEAYERVAQLIIVPVVLAKFIPVTSIDKLSDTSRGKGGFGHTGNK